MFPQELLNQGLRHLDSHRMPHSMTERAYQESDPTYQNTTCSNMHVFSHHYPSRTSQARDNYVIQPSISIFLYILKDLKKNMKKI